MQEISYPGTRTANIKAQPRSQRHPHLMVPSLRLSGAWLEDLGFEPSQRVNIITGKKVLIIRAED